MILFICAILKQGCFDIRSFGGYVWPSRRSSEASPYLLEGHCASGRLGTFLSTNMEVVSGKVDCHSVEFRAKKRSGEYVWIKCRGQMIYDKEGNQELFAGIMCLMGKPE